MGLGHYGYRGKDGQDHFGGGRVAGQFREKREREAHHQDQRERRQVSRALEAAADQLGETGLLEAGRQRQAAADQQDDVPRQPRYQLGAHQATPSALSASRRDEEHRGSHRDGHRAVVDEVRPRQQSRPARNRERPEVQVHAKHPQQGGRGEHAEHGAFLERDRPEPGALLLDHFPIRGRLARRAVQHLRDQQPRREQHHHAHRERDDHPLAEGDGRCRREEDFVDALERQVRRGADQRRESAHRAAVGDA